MGRVDVLPRMLQHGDAQARVMLLAGWALVGVATWLVIVRHPRWGGAAAAGSGLLLVAGSLRAGRTSDEVFVEWRGDNDYTRGEMRKRGRDGSIATSVGPYPVELQAFHLASEYATHADDMGAPISEDEKLRRLAWRLAFSKVALEEAEKGVKLETADGRNKVSAGGKDATLSDADFVEAVSGRLKTIDPELQEALRALA